MVLVSRHALAAPGLSVGKDESAGSPARVHHGIHRRVEPRRRVCGNDHVSYIASLCRCDIALSVQQLQLAVIERLEIALELRGVLEIFHERRVFRNQFRAPLMKGREQVVVPGRFVREPLENGRFVGRSVQFRAGLSTGGLGGFDGSLLRGGKRRRLSDGFGGGDGLMEACDLPLPGFRENDRFRHLPYSGLGRAFLSLLEFQGVRKVLLLFRRSQSAGGGMDIP